MTRSSWSSAFGGTDWIRPTDCESATCLEVRRNGVGQVILRQSTSPRHLVAVDPAEFIAFIEAAKAGFYDGLAGSD